MDCLEFYLFIASACVNYSSVTSLLHDGDSLRYYQYEWRRLIYKRKTYDIWKHKTLICYCFAVYLTATKYFLFGRTRRTLSFPANQKAAFTHSIFKLQDVSFPRSFASQVKTRSFLEEKKHQQKQKHILKTVVGLKTKNKPIYDLCRLSTQEKQYFFAAMQQLLPTALCYIKKK